MFISKECFADSEIRAMIEQDGETGDCDITGAKEIVGYNTENPNRTFDLSDNLSEILYIYSPESELPKDFPVDRKDYLENILANNWSIFSDKVAKNRITTIVKAICKDAFPLDDARYHEKVGIKELSNPDYLSKICLTKDTDWESFMNSIKSINRFHSNHLNLEVLADLFKSESLLKIISPKDKVEFFRGRICGEQGCDTGEMGAPKKDETVAGRVNCQGIRCLYLANDLKTVVHEIKARDFEYVTIGSFSPRRKLQLINLSILGEISPFTAGLTFGFEWFAINMPILKKICFEIAKPLRRQEGELDYLPTQYIADFIKSQKFDGICYQSTLCDGGINYAIFDPKKFACNRTELLQINSVKYNYKQLSTESQVKNS